MWYVQNSIIVFQLNNEIKIKKFLNNKQMLFNSHYNLGACQNKSKKYE